MILLLIIQRIIIIIEINEKNVMHSFMSCLKGDINLLDGNFDQIVRMGVLHL